jgi:hypothetical protein
MQRLPVLLIVSVSLVGLLNGQRPAPASLPPGARLYVAPMEWNLDRFVTAEIQQQGLPLRLVERPEDADFVMMGLYQGLGSHFLSPGHYIQVKIVRTEGGKQVWFGDANDYALFFARLRHHGPGRAAEAIVKRLRLDMSANGQQVTK